MDLRIYGFTDLTIYPFTDLRIYAFTDLLSFTDFTDLPIYRPKSNEDNDYGAGPRLWPPTGGGRLQGIWSTLHLELITGDLESSGGGWYLYTKQSLHNI